MIFEAVEFQWDENNREKNWKKHQVSNTECEEIFVDKEKIIFDDVFHSEKEARVIILGKTKADRLLFVVFTIRGSKIRIISVRDADKKEEKLYEEND
jgi:uncharacterized DUF497 family protein